MVSCITFVQHPDCELKNSQLPVKSHLEALTKINSHNFLAYHHGALRRRRTALKRTLSSCRAVTMSRW